LIAICSLHMVFYSARSYAFTWKKMREDIAQGNQHRVKNDLEHFESLSLQFQIKTGNFSKRMEEPIPSQVWVWSSHCTREEIWKAGGDEYFWSLGDFFLKIDAGIGVDWTRIVVIWHVDLQFPIGWNCGWADFSSLIAFKQKRRNRIVLWNGILIWSRDKWSRNSGFIIGKDLEWVDSLLRH